MIVSLRGVYRGRASEGIVVEANGVGYEVLLPPIVEQALASEAKVEFVGERRPRGLRSMVLLGAGHATPSDDAGLSEALSSAPVHKRALFAVRAAAHDLLPGSARDGSAGCSARRSSRLTAEQMIAGEDAKDLLPRPAQRAHRLIEEVQIQEERHQVSDGECLLEG